MEQRSVLWWATRFFMKELLTSRVVVNAIVNLLLLTLVYMSYSIGYANGKVSSDLDCAFHLIQVGESYSNMQKNKDNTEFQNKLEEGLKEDSENPEPSPTPPKTNKKDFQL